MVTNPLDMKYIHRRNRFLERRKTITESANTSLPDLSGDHIAKDYYNLRIEAYLRENCSSYRDALHILEFLYSNNDFELLEVATNIVTDTIIPMVESSELPTCISIIESSNIGNINKDRILEAAKTYKTVDRIRKNHRNISKRFDLSNMKHCSNRDTCFKICEMVDTYDQTKFIKFNIALEEIAYLGYMNGNRMSDEVMVENASDYFLMINDNNLYDVESYRKAIRSSKVIGEGADVNIPYLMKEGSYSNSKYWKDRVNTWKLYTSKDLDSLVEIARDNFSNITVLNSIVSLINEYCTINSIEYNIGSIFENAEESVDGQEAHNIISFVKENKVDTAEELLENLNLIWESDLNDIVYDDGTESSKTYTSNEIDRFKMNNLVRDSNSAKEFLDQLEKTSMKESPNSINRIPVPEEKISESSIIDLVDADGYISMNIRSYSFSGTTESVHDLLESSILCMNNILYNTESRAYYNLYENQFDICIRSKYKVILSEAEEMSRSFSNYDKNTILSIKEYTDKLEEIYESQLLEIASKLSEDKSIAANITPKEAALLYEVLSPYSESSSYNSNDSFLDEFVNLCRLEANPKYDSIKRECDSIQHESFDYSDDNLSRIEFCASMLGLNEGVVDNVKNASKEFATGSKNVVMNLGRGIKNLTKDPKSLTKDSTITDNTLPSVEKNAKPSNTDKDYEIDKASVDKINDLRLAWKGVKSKAKNLSAKEQEMSRDMDIQFNHMLKTIKQGLEPDHREEIITGEVNHSLSKAIKIAIGLAAPTGIAAAALGGSFAWAAIAPIVAAVVTFARSKYTTTKEKKLIIDEIDVELQVLDREINRAEQSGSTRKYRELLTIKKNLMRKRQELYYNMARKGQKIPMQATKGMRTRE